MDFKFGDKCFYGSEQVTYLGKRGRTYKNLEDSTLTLIQRANILDGWDYIDKFYGREAMSITLKNKLHCFGVLKGLYWVNATSITKTIIKRR
jgi:hypothetical protein